MKNVPQQIYLQVGEEATPSDDFQEMTGISWCEDQINENDIRYTKANKPFFLIGFVVGIILVTLIQVFCS